MTFLLTFLLAALLSLVLTPTVTAISRRKGWFDGEGERKIHSGQIPRLGGTAIALSFFLSFPIALAIINGLFPGKFHITPSLVLLFASGLGFHLLGLVDDFRDLRARLKLAVQLGLAICIVAAGYSFKVVEIPMAPFRIDLGLFGPVLTVVWIVGITNALNLIDGMDGLASGIALIGATVWAMLYLKTSQYLPALVALAAIGSILGFLFFNFPPATIFMGDSGSLFLGFILAVLPLLRGPVPASEAGLIPAFTICLIPILDTFAAILRRWRRHVSFFTADKYHLHHKMLNLGFSARQILAIIYSLTALLGFSVLAGVYVNPRVSFILMMGSWILWGAIFILLHLLKERKVRLIGKKCEGAE